MGSRQKAVVKGMSKIAGELNAEMMKNDKVIRDQHRALFSEMAGKTGSQQSVLDRMLQEIQFLRDHEGGPMDEEVIDILRGKIADLERQRDELKADAERYQELLYAVQRKFPNESRHETALRYIKHAEAPSYSNAAKELK